MTDKIETKSEITTIRLHPSTKKMLIGDFGSIQSAVDFFISTLLADRITRKSFDFSSGIKLKDQFRRSSLESDIKKIDKITSHEKLIKVPDGNTR